MQEIKRKCQGCSKIQNRDLMIKITKLKNGTLKINPASNELGRSIYVCKNINCIKTLIKKKKIKSALKYNNIDEIITTEEQLKKLLP